MNIRLHKLGTEKIKVFDDDFDNIYDIYKLKAEKDGYYGELKFIKEHGNIVVYTIIKIHKV